MWERWVKWRIESKADNIKEEDILTEAQTGKAFFYGYDKKNNPLLICKIKKHFPKLVPFE